MNTIYIAAPWIYRAEAAAAADYLTSQGFTITSRWIRGHGNTNDPLKLQEDARHDLTDLCNSEALVLLNLGLSDGKATELGMAIMRNMRIVVVGSKNGNIFYHLLQVTNVNTLAEVPKALGPPVPAPIYL